MCPEARGAEALAGWEVVCLLVSWCGCYGCVCVGSRVGVAGGLGVRRALVEEERSLLSLSLGRCVCVCVVCVCVFVCVYVYIYTYIYNIYAL